ncbi:MAG: mechanosensitive ion channel family protein [Lachnospiraceae bacterium]|jgi:small conductance mechanosensitive channel|nr:mechanosensitive ion channel family protein [Lachnospiraceae bacterium]MCR5530660.1 mechanosensitive ion channel family protein [Lachnospiraceae bacterium]
MKENKKVFIRLIVLFAIFAVAFAVGLIGDYIDFDNLEEAFGSFQAIRLLYLLCMVCFVLFLETLLVFLLGLFEPESHRAKSVLSIVSSMLKYITAIVILCWGLSILGCNVSTIVASVGILALVIGFSAESLIADVVTGTFMLFENQYNVGDIVEVGGFRGTVTNIGIRTTCITDPGGNVKIVNNSAMQNILNRSDKMSRAVSDIAIPYPTDLEKLESQLPKLMDEILAAHPDVMKEAPRYLGVQELADSAVVLRFVVNVDEKDIYSGARLLNRDLLLGFRKLGVECPYPQMDVHLDKQA